MLCFMIHCPSLTLEQTEFVVDMKCEGCVSAVKSKLETLEDFLVSAAVAEFKGPEIFGVVRFAQTHMDWLQLRQILVGCHLGNMPGL
ncbi:Copper chaperone for superoxide dismutase chloroplastic/cytosolic [Bienertia sinuspersici]